MSDKLSWMCSIDDCERPRVGSLDICETHRSAQAKEIREASKPVKTPTPLKRTPIKKVSPKRKEEMKDYSTLRRDYLKENPVCEANLRACTGNSEEIHHKAKRGANYLNVKTFMDIAKHSSTHC